MAEYIYSADPIGEGEYSHTLVGEVVRCRDCIWRMKDGTCARLLTLGRVDPDDYCSRGERGTDG